MSTVDNHQEVVRFNSQKAITDPYASGTKHDKKYREILHHAPRNQAEQDLYLKLKDESPKVDWINLFLGRSKVFDKDYSPQRYNVVVPIVPRCYTTTDRNPVHADVPPKGWIYIIRRRKSTQGPMLVELWRELKSDGKGFFQDVNLKNFKKRDHREATGQAGFRIIVPYCIDKEPHELWIAYSEVQWSWARVQNIKKDSKLREQRMHKLDLSDSLNDFENSKYDGAAAAPSGGPKAQQSIKDVSGPALIYNLESAPDTFSNRLTKGLKDPIPVVYLDNPVGIAKNLGLFYQQACTNMRNYVRLLGKAPGVLQGEPPKSDSKKTASKKLTPEQKKILKALRAEPYDPLRWFDSAKILNRYLYTDFPTKAPDDWTKEQKDEFPKLKADAERKFLKYRSKIDKADIDRALGTDRRKILRRNIEITKGWLTDFLEHELVTLGDKSALLQALDDYFTLPAEKKGVQPITITVGKKDITVWPDCYADGWKAVTDIIRYLGKHLYAHDEELVSPAPDGWNLRKDDAGMKLLEKIADPQKNLLIHERLFPTPQASSATKVDREAKVEDDEAKFKARHFDSLKGDPLARCLTAITEFGRQFEEVVAMDDRADDAYRKAVNRIKCSITLLTNGIINADFDHYNVPVADILAFKQEVQSDFQALRRPALVFAAVGDIYFEPINTALKKEADTVIKANLKFDTGGPGATSIKTTRGSRYEVKQATLRRAGNSDNLTGLKITTETGEEIILQPRCSGSKKAKTGSRPYYSEVILGLNEEARQELMDRIGSNEDHLKALGGMVAVIETISMINALQAVMNNRNDDLRGELVAELISSFGDVAGALENLIDDGGKALADDVAKGAFKVKLADDIAKQAELLQATKVLQVMGHVGSAIDIGLTLKSLIENFRQNDDAYIGDSVLLVGACLTAVGGTAAGASLAVLIGLSVAWITGIGLLLLLIGYLLKRFVFPDDTSLEIWLVNGPFACGESTHPHFLYQKEVHTEPLQAPDGSPAPAAFTRHIYDNAAWLSVDYAGKLVEVGGPNPRGDNRLFRRDGNGNVYLKAGKYGNNKNPLIVERDTLIGTIGQPYEPHSLLQPTTDPGDARFDGHTPGKDPGERVCMNPCDPFGIVVQDVADAKNRHRFALWCELPKEAYRALMDALYRPTVTSREVKLNDKHEVWLHIHTPFLLPKSVLHLDFVAKRTYMGSLVVDDLPPIKYTLDSNSKGQSPKRNTSEDRDKEFRDHLIGGSISDSISAQYRMEHPASLQELEDGPNRFTIRLENRRSMKCTLKVRLDLFGKQEVCLPWEPIFCGRDISTDKDGHRWIQHKRTFELPR